MPRIFKDISHEQFYEGNVIRANREHDPYRRALFYLLGLTDETRHHIHDVYDFQEESIRLEGIQSGWQTGTSSRLTRLAFNLYSGYTGKDELNAYLYSPYYLFDTQLMPFFFEAVRLRYPEYNQSFEPNMRLIEPSLQNQEYEELGH
ncbi:DUF6075 family protein [Paenibacillus massiliensis]|uniref:DUF6075 family protein n=1 Tax=Paenibacillus massiliensis TaxID=225917 RepID=UPI00036A10F9|nr:DUF6075 family protein [Paenibacillus massiliensis]